MSEEKLAEIQRINVEVGMNCQFDCKNCYRFFLCKLPEKWDILAQGRMDKIREKMGRIRHKIAVLSGKGGVGKSTVTANLTIAFAQMGMNTSIIDSDFYGPSIPKMLGVKDKRLRVGREIIPAKGPLNIKVLSTAFLMEEDEHITWFDDLKRDALEEFLSHVDYGDLDYLIIDLPPGTGAETINIMKYIPDIDGAVVVTIPSEVSQGVARRGIANLNMANVKVIGVIENMSGFVCPKCGGVSNVLQYGGGERLAKEMGVPFLGRIPLDERVSATSDNGEPFIIRYPDSPSGKAFKKIVEKIKNIIKE